MKGGRGVGPVELKRKRGSGGRGGGRTRNRQRYVQAIVVPPPLANYPLVSARCLKQPGLVELPVLVNTRTSSGLSH